MFAKILTSGVCFSIFDNIGIISLLWTSLFIMVMFCSNHHTLYFIESWASTLSMVCQLPVIICLVRVGGTKNQSLAFKLHHFICNPGYIKIHLIFTRRISTRLSSGSPWKSVLEEFYSCLLSLFLSLLCEVPNLHDSKDVW